MTGSVVIFAWGSAIWRDERDGRDETNPIPIRPDLASRTVSRLAGPQPANEVSRTVW
jgi:hypothetical protein